MKAQQIPSDNPKLSAYRLMAAYCCQGIHYNTYYDDTRIIVKPLYGISPTVFIYDESVPFNAPFVVAETVDCPNF